MYSLIVDNLGRYTAFRYKDIFISIQGWTVVICNVGWYSQQSYDLSCMKNER